MTVCKTCGSDLSDQPRGQIDVPCKCGSNVKVSISSIDVQRGVMVVHDTLDPNQDWEKVDTLNANSIKLVRCSYTTYVPPAIWCPTCKAHLIPQWKDLCVTGTSAEVEAAQQNYHPTVIHYRQMARELIKQYGPLRRVEFLSHFPKFEINFVFENRTVLSGERRGEYDVHFLSLGYVGEGPRYAREFLAEAGFSMSADDIAAIKPGAVICLQNGTVAIEYPSNQEHQSVLLKDETQTGGRGGDKPTRRKWWRIWN